MQFNFNCELNRVCSPNCDSARSDLEHAWANVKLFHGRAQFSQTFEFSKDRTLALEALSSVAERQDSVTDSRACEARARLRIGSGTRDQNQEKCESCKLNELIFEVSGSRFNWISMCSVDLEQARDTVTRSLLYASVLDVQ